MSDKREDNNGNGRWWIWIFILSWFIIFPLAILCLWNYHYDYIISKPVIFQAFLFISSVLSFYHHVIMGKNIDNVNRIEEDYIKIHLYKLIPTLIEFISFIITMGIVMYIRVVFGDECNLLPIWLSTIIVTPLSKVVSSHLLNWYNPKKHKLYKDINLPTYSKYIIKSFISFLTLYLEYEPISKFIMKINNYILNTDIMVYLIS